MPTLGTAKAVLFYADCLSSQGLCRGMEPIGVSPQPFGSLTSRGPAVAADALPTPWLKAGTIYMAAAGISAVITSRHARDSYGWVEEQGAALRDHDSCRLDWSGLEQELAALGRQEYPELLSRLGVLLGHLLKWQWQPERRSRSWFCSIREQWFCSVREKGWAIERQLKQNPSLRGKAADALADGYEAGVDLVLRDTELPLRCLQAASAWSLEQALEPTTLCDTRGDWDGSSV